jgi:hypothetical protein
MGRDLVKCSYPDYAPLDSEGNKTALVGREGQER